MFLIELGCLLPWYVVGFAISGFHPGTGDESYTITLCILDLFKLLLLYRMHKGVQSAFYLCTCFLAYCELRLATFRISLISNADALLKNMAQLTNQGQAPARPAPTNGAPQAGQPQADPSHLLSELNTGRPPSRSGCIYWTPLRTALMRNVILWLVILLLLLLGATSWLLLAEMETLRCVNLYGRALGNNSLWESDSFWAVPYAWPGEGACGYDGMSSWYGRDRVNLGMHPETPLLRLVLIASSREAFFRAVYFTTSTLTTTGYGDIRPRSPIETFFQAILVWFAAIIVVIQTVLLVALFRALANPSADAHKLACRQLLKKLEREKVRLCTNV